ncbi:hypothetical protein GCM10022255_059370 [Dactylosporangium darangshiense]|uniref:HTH tetR-type domain-containing protein n=1 Tax=Dactylosporangium darangshiense TaxID=579108 RepID=A0ABP8DF43_9ACTN
MAFPLLLDGCSAATTEEKAALVKGGEPAAARCPEQAVELRSARARMASRRPVDKKLADRSSIVKALERTSDARDKILKAAAGLLEQRGYSAPGPAEVCTVAGVPKGSSYYSNRAVSRDVMRRSGIVAASATVSAVASPAPSVHQ